MARLSFCVASQDGDEGVLRLHRLPTPDQSLMGALKNCVLETAIARSQEQL